IAEGPGYFTRCSFVMNEGLALLRLGDGSTSLVSCVFRNNDYALVSDGGEILNCTFVKNLGSISLLRPLQIRNTVIAFNDDAIHCMYSFGTTASCCDIFDNGSRDWAECLAGQGSINGNFSADPLFCDPQAGNLTLSAASPCAFQPGQCGLIGALPV